MQDIQEALQALKFGGAMVYPLLLLAVLALVITIDKLYVYWRYVRLPQALLELVETYGFAWADLERDLAAARHEAEASHRDADALAARVRDLLSQA